MTFNANFDIKHRIKYFLLQIPSKISSTSNFAYKTYPNTTYLLTFLFQRLVKYPLLLEQLAKHTPGPESSDDEGQLSDEVQIVRRCVERTRNILESIDKRVAEAQNVQRLQEIQRNLDTSGLEKMPESAICAEYRVSSHIIYKYSYLELCSHRTIQGMKLSLNYFTCVAVLI